jgi:hypothetical protein
MIKSSKGGCVQKDDFATRTLAGKNFYRSFAAILNKPGRRANPIPTKPEEEEEEARPGKESPKRKKKTRAYEVTC